MRFRSRRLRVPAVAALAAALLAPAGIAHATAVEVVDTAGRPQVAALTAASGERWWTGADGRAQVPADAVVVSRAPGDSCGGEEGVAVAPGLASARVVLPALQRPGTRPDLDAEERHLLELVVAHRAAIGRATKHSDVLDRTADWYATVLARAGRIDHCLVRSPTARAHATGFPGAAVGEALSTGGEDVSGVHFERWLRSPPHRATIEAFAVGTFGVAHVGGTWVLLTSGDCAGGVVVSALHGRAGDGCGWSAPGASGLEVAAEPAPAPTGAVTATAKLDPRLRVTLRRAGRRVRVVATLAPGARGRLRLTVAGRSRYVRAASGKLDTTLRLKPGRYSVAVAFSGSAPWRSARASTSLRVH